MSVFGCIEPFEIKNEINSLESLLVIETTLTDEMKAQMIILSQSTSFLQGTSVPEYGATVSIDTDFGETFDFTEQTSGQYVSDQDFRAEEGVGYQMRITRSNGDMYESDVVLLQGKSKIDSVYAERIINGTGEEGIGIFIDSEESSVSNRFFRYSYEETYKIIAPNWDPFGFNVFTNDSGERGFNVLAREEEQLICYNTLQSSTIIQADTEDITHSNLSGFRVRFIDRSNFIIGHRYSILVKQVLQTPEASEFYRLLENFSASESVFTNAQPGFINGNISAVDTDQPTLGYFNVVSISEKRLFFNYEDFFPDEPLPPYPFECTVYTPSILAIEDILNNRVSYVGDNENPEEGQLPYFVTSRPCGDCTALGSNIVPDFWIE